MNPLDPINTISKDFFQKMYPPEPNYTIFVDENGDEVLGEYGKMFEEEYISVLNQYISLIDSPYQKYLREVCSDVSRVHNGYFSIDKKTGRSIDSQLKRGSEFSDDISAYELILKQKERLLSFDTPLKFIFSHSALREGWDNPNVFQVCTLIETKDTFTKRQKIGRGLRISVNQSGERVMDYKFNTLSVIANESYKEFATTLQKEFSENGYKFGVIESVSFAGLEVKDKNNV